ncbi:interactor of HORMAD1 protein 1 [Pogona vitticeps]
MSVNVWNIKELFSIPTKMGPSKSSSWTSAPGDYSSMSDSQFLFGSQFCPENSQSTSAPTEFSIQQRQEKSSQQNSQDNEPSIFAKYQSKPQLFGGDGKDKGSLNFPPGRFKGVLEQFEENKKKIKEKHDNEVLNTFILNTKESLQRLQSSFDKSEESLKSILDDLGNFSKTMQETSQSHYGLVLNALKERHEMEQTLFRMEKRMQDKDTEISDLKSDLQLLKMSLEQLTVQQNEQYVKLCELLGHVQIPSLLAELQAFISTPRALCHVKENSSQTSPDMLSTQFPYNPQDNVLSTPPGIKVFSTVPGSEGKEHVDIQQQEASCLLARGQDADNTLSACGFGAAITTASQQGYWLLTQELCQDTPVRKVIKRNNRLKGLNIVRPSQLHKNDSAFMQNKASEQKNENLATDKKMQSKGRSISVKGGKPKISSQRKKIYSSKKGGNCLKSAYASRKQNITRKGFSKSEKPQHHCRDTGEPNLGTSVVSEKRMRWARHGKAEKGKLALQSQESKQYVANLQEMSGIKRGENLPSTKNCCFWARSSPEGSASPNQMRWLSLFDNHSPACKTPLQHKTTAYCPLFFDSEYSD